MIGALASLITQPQVLDLAGVLAVKAMEKLTPTVSKWMGIDAPQSYNIAGISPVSIKQAKYKSAVEELKKRKMKVPDVVMSAGNEPPRYQDVIGQWEAAKAKEEGLPEEPIHTGNSANNKLDVVIPNSIMNQTMLGNENLSMQNRPVPIPPSNPSDIKNEPIIPLQSYQFGVRRYKVKAVKEMKPASLNRQSFTASKQYAIGGVASSPVIIRHRRNKMLKSGIY
jgi:hypothetical protein